MKMDLPDNQSPFATQHFASWHYRMTWGASRPYASPPLESLLLPPPDVEPYQVPPQDGETPDEKNNREALNLYLAGGTFYVPTAEQRLALLHTVGGTALRVVIDPLLPPDSIYVMPKGWLTDLRTWNGGSR